MRSFKKNKKKNSWTKTEDLKNIDLNAWLGYDDKYIKTKIRILCLKIVGIYKNGYQRNQY